MFRAHEKRTQERDEQQSPKPFWCAKSHGFVEELKGCSVKTFSTGVILSEAKNLGFFIPERLERMLRDVSLRSE
jgi:hypothetical protein